MRVSRTLAFALGAILLAVSPATSHAAEYDELTKAYEGFVRIESELLDMRSEVEAMLSEPDALLTSTGGGRIEAIPRTTLRDNAGMLYDWTVSLGIAEWVAPLLSPENRAVLETGIDTGLGRIEAVNKVEDMFVSRQPALRATLEKRLVDLEQLLGEVRAGAAEALAARDALSSPEGGIPDGRVCFDPNVPMTASAQNWAMYYGVGPWIPMKGNFLCYSWMGFIEATAGQLRAFSCDMSVSPPACVLNRVDPYVEDVDPENGDRLLRLSEEAYYRIGPPF